MKNFFFLLGTGLLFTMVGCASTPVGLAPVGPNPVNPGSDSSLGRLQVFSRAVDRTEDRNQGGDGLSDWRQHSDYSLYDMRGKLVRHVGNAAGYYSAAPESIALPPGRYLVKAEAKDYLWIDVPVMIERGRTTRVHLDDSWRPAADASRAELVTLPNGTPVGWRAEAPQQISIN